MAQRIRLDLGEIGKRGERLPRSRKRARKGIGETGLPSSQKKRFSQEDFSRNA
jgi:hypothetical protein